VSNYTDSARFNTSVIRNSDEQDTKKFCELLLKSSDYNNHFPLPAFPLFVEANMFLSKMHWSAGVYKCFYKGNKLGSLSQERKRLHRACFDPSAITAESKSKPCWTRDDFFIIMKKNGGLLFYAMNCH